MENYEIFDFTMNTADTNPNINLDLSLATKIGDSKSQMDQTLIQADITLI